MVSLPPELVRAIVESAAECDSTLDSYSSRQRSLSALTLVNQTFHEIAQPLLLRRIRFDKRKSLEQSDLDENQKEHVWQVMWQLEARSVQLDFVGFSNLKELRVYDVDGFALKVFNGHQHLTKLSLERLQFNLSQIEGNFILPNLVEFSLDGLEVVPARRMPDRPHLPFFTASKFPSLRALGIVATDFLEAQGPFDETETPSIPRSFLKQLDCLTISTGGYRETPEPESTRITSPLPPILYDMNPHHTTTAWGRSSILPLEVASRTHVRIRLPCEPIPHRRQVEAALFLVETLLNESILLKELYLDLYPRDGRRGYRLDEELQERIRKFEDPNRKTKVEIVWENHEDDWCRSRISKEFWRRCKEKKEKRRAMNS